MNQQEIKYQEAKRRVRELRSFYVHLTVYIIVNSGLFLINMIITPGHLWFFWPILGWGIAIIIHALRIFGFGGSHDADWEEKKIKEFMQDEQ